MSHETQLACMHALLNERIESLRGSRKWYRSRYHVIQLIVIVLSALITIIAGFKGSWLLSDYASNAVLVLGALSTSCAAYGAIFSVQNSWHLTARAYSELLGLRARLQFEELAPEFQAREREVVEKVFADFQEILRSYNESWQQLRKGGK